MKNLMFKLCLLVVLLCGLPLLGVELFAERPDALFEFPPLTLYVQHAAFSPPVFIVLLAVLAAVLAPFVLRIFLNGGGPPSPLSDERGSSSPRAGGPPPEKETGKTAGSFPLWGWGGLLLGLVAWVLAWNRFPFFAPLQPHTFFPLWLSYILVVSAFTQKRTGHCLLSSRPKLFFWLFPFSSAFWWFFEYLNRFVQNWEYRGVENFTATTYVLFASFSFATVLPAVLSTTELLRSFRLFRFGFSELRPMPWVNKRSAHVLVLMVAAVGLLLLGVYPNFLYPLLWVSPLLVLTGIQGVRGRPTLFSPTAKGDWNLLVSTAVATLICGFFWEMWNMFSYARWIYHVPYVQAWHVFEMPLPGFAGYLPFGWESLAVAMLLAEIFPVQACGLVSTEGVLDEA